MIRRPGVRDVVDPSGQHWTVFRRWLPVPKRRLLRRFNRNRVQDTAEGGLNGCTSCDVDVEAVAIAAAVVGLLVVLALFGVPILVLVTELLWLTVLFVAGVFARFVLGHPWQVELRRSGPEDFSSTRRFGVRGYRAAGRLRDDIVDRLARNLPLPTEGEISGS